MDGAKITQAKQAWREKIWELLATTGAAVDKAKVRDRIPNFKGARQAAEQLAQTEEWKAARVVVVNPDKAQIPVRRLALAEGKVVYMSFPRLAGDKPFIKLDPELLRSDGVDRETVVIHEGASEYAKQYGRFVTPQEMPAVDMKVSGSVAIDAEGRRLGKGGGYSDQEWAMLKVAGLLEGATLATTVDQLQLLTDASLPEEPHDFRVDLVATQAGIMRPALDRRKEGYFPR